MKKYYFLFVFLLFILASCIREERDDAVRLEGMMPKETDAMVERMMEQSEGVNQ